MELTDALTWIISGGGAGLIAYWLMEKRLERFLGWLFQKKVEWTSEFKGYFSFALAMGVADLAFWATVQLGYAPTPGTPQEWLEKLFAVALASVGVSKFVHSRRVLRLKDIKNRR